MSDSVIQKISNSETLLDILIQIEDFLDSMDIYAFQNWVDGTVYDGPFVSKYWYGVTLMYPWDSMPDPAGAIRLVNMGIKVKYKESEKEDIDLSTKPSDRINIDTLSTLSYGQSSRGITLNQVIQNNGNRTYDKIWLVDITIPTHFIDDQEDIDQEEFDQVVQDSLYDKYHINDNDTQIENQESETSDEDIF